MTNHPLQDVLDMFRNKTPDEIAAVVAEHKIKGRTGTTSRCPLALLLHGVSTGTYVVGRSYIARVSGRRIDKAHTPDNMKAFIRKFDSGDYPQLIAPAPRCVFKPKRRRKPRLNQEPRATHPIKNHLAKMVQRFAPEK